MLFTNNYKVVQKKSKGYYLEKNSKFISYCFIISSEFEVKERIKEIKKKEKSANHYCYAFVLNPDKSSQKHFDDGEPSSSAGKPILNQINIHDLTNILIIVVRYFGGRKLGINGLIRSYKNAAKNAIENTTILKKEILEKYEINFEFNKLSNVMKIIKKNDVTIINKNIKNNCNLQLSIKKASYNQIFNDFKKNKIILKYIK